jgi:hydrogenase expression/formation protein HypC
MKVIEIFDDTAVVELSGTRSVISTMLLEEVNVGEFVIVHAGFGIQVLDEKEAEETLSLIRQLVEGEE